MKNSYYTIQVIIFIFNMGISWWFLDNVLIDEEKIKYRNRIIFLILVFFLYIIGGEVNGLAGIIGYYTILFIYAIYIKAKISLINIFWIIKCMSECLSIFLMVYIFGALFKNYTFLEFYYDNSFLRESLFLGSVLFRMRVLKTHMKQKKIIENLSNRQVLISSLIFLIIQYFLVVTLRNIIEGNNIITIEEGILIVLLFIVSMFFYKILMFLSQEIEEKYFLEMSIKKTELEKKYVKEISQIYTDIRSWKHDYRNNINVICNLAIANKHDELFRYIEELDEEIKVAEAIIYTGIFIIDSVITSKYLYGNSKGVKFDINTGKIKKGNISDFDINIILSNLLDNAIEGALKSEEKTIYINIFEKNNSIVFKIKNTFDGNVKKLNGNYITTKGGSIHGLGINRVKNTINKYNGSIYIDNKNNIFENKVIIPIC